MFKELKEKERQARQALIMDVTEKLFQEEGYDSVTIRHVAEKIDVSAGTIYTYFGSKEELIVCILIRNIKKLEKEIDKSLKLEDPVKVLTAMAKNYADYYIRFGRYVNIMDIITMVENGDSPVAVEVIEQLKDAVMAILDKIAKKINEDKSFKSLTKGIPIERAAAAMWAIVHGISYIALPLEKGTGKGWFNFDQILSDVIHLLLTKGKSGAR